MTVGSPLTEDRIHALLQQIVQQVQQEDTVPKNNLGETAVVLECEINSMRYTLTCQPATSTSPSAHLSPREEEIVRLITKGLSNKEVAAVLDISPWTVATHLRRIFNKLDVGSRAEMVARVLNDNLLKQTQDGLTSA